MKKNLLLFALLLLISGAMLAQVAPSVTTTNATNITQTSATVGGIVVDSYGATVSDRGIYYSIAPSPSTQGEQVSANSGGIGPFSVDLNNLTPGTTYHVIAYATNSEGSTGMGEVLSFSTEAAYTITTNVTPPSSGQVTGGGTNFIYGNQTTLTATASNGYTFSQWQDNNTENPRTITVTGNATYTATFTQDIYTITTNVTPPSSGQVTGGGTNFHYGDQPTLTATASNGYTFSHWQDGNTENPRTITVTGNATYTATFTQDIYTITTNVTPPSSGQVTGGGTNFHYGDQPTLTATASNGYTFSHWQDGNTENPRTITVTGNATYTAVFTQNIYTITASANPNIGGEVSVSGTGSFTYGQQCTLTATVNEGYTFINWTKNGSEVSASASYTFLVVEAGDYVANFTLNSYTVTAQADPPAGGTVTGSGGFNHGETCTLVATANTGYTFVNWTKNGTEVCTTPTYTFTVTESASYVAHFLINSYEITVTANPSNGGTVSGGGTYNHFQSCTLTASQAEGHTFVNWTKNGTQVSTNPIYTFTVEGAGDYVATFSLNQYTITTNVTPTGTGTVAGGGTYYYGDDATLTATPNYGYHFSQWQDGNTDNPRTITVSNNALYTATFAPNSYTITTGVTPEGTGTVSGGGTYTYGSQITLTATNEYGYHFDQWQDGNTNSTRTVTVSQDATYTATFLPNSYTITTNPSPWGAGTVSGGGTYPYNTSATLQADPNYGYHFDHWQDGITDNPRSITVSQNATYTAYFIKNQYTITTGVEPDEDWGNVTGGGTYDYQSNIQLIANPNPGYSFQHWQDNNEQNPRLISVTANASYTATFTRNQYIITTQVTPTGTGTVTGGGSFYYGDNTTLTPHANSGYIFQGWTDGNMDNPRHIIVTNTATYTAVFGPIGTTYYNVTASVSPNGAGTVTGTGPFPEGSTTTLTAIANTGYTFNHWQDGNTQSTRTVTVNSNLSFTAYFTQNTYTITTIVNPTDAGSVTGGGTNFHYGDQTTLQAFANEGYEFDHWNDGLNQNPRTITVTGNVTFTAYFTAQALNQYTINTEVTPAGAGTVEGGGTYSEGETATLIATVNPCYTFSQWQDGNTDNPRDITVMGDGTYTAIFTLNTYTITTEVTPANAGMVEDGGEYDCGETATLTAVPEEGYRFDQWDDGVVTNPRTISVTNNATYTAKFLSNQYTITLFPDPLEGGQVEGCGDYTYGEECTIIATENPGYVFYGWFENDSLVYSNFTETFIVTCDRTLVAKFADETACLIFVDIDPTGAGSVIGSGPFPPGEICTLTAYAKPGYEFKNWTKLDEVVSEDAVYTFTVTETAYYVAHFERKKYTVTVTVNPDGGGTVSGHEGQFTHGTYCTLEASPNDGYTFVNWINNSNGAVVGINPTYTFRVEADASFTANFTQVQKHTIRVQAEPEDGGVVYVGEPGVTEMEITHGEACTVTAEVNEDYSFVNWTENDVEVSTEAVYSFTVGADRNLVAHFRYTKEWKIIVSSNNDEWGTVAGGGTFIDGAECQLKATPKEGYIFVNWTEDGDVVCEDPTYQFTVKKDRDLVANFKEKSCLGDLQRIQPKYHHTSANDSIVLVLIYPNPQYNYTYQWYKNGNAIPGATGQYYYQKGGVDDGVYKVKLSLSDGCSDYTENYYVNQGKRLCIYPNPSRRGNEVVVEKDCEGQARLTIYSVDGRALYSEMVTDSQVTLNLNLPVGVYVARLTDSEGNTKIGKLIIK